MRQGSVTRTTGETDIKASINLDGEGRSDISTGIAFMDHMLTLFAKHGKFDLEVSAKGDLEVDCHHTMEDLDGRGACIDRAGPFRQTLSCL